jgi:hypothetical protein
MEIPPNETHQPPLAGPLLSDMILNEQVEDREQEIKRDFKAPLPVGYLIASIAIILLIILALLLSHLM